MLTRTPLDPIPPPHMLHIVIAGASTSHPVCLCLLICPSIRCLFIFNPVSVHPPPPCHRPFLSLPPCPASELRDNFEAGHVCWDDRDLSAHSGRPTGTVRATLGALSTFEEVHLLLQLVRRYFVVANGSPTSTSSSSSSPSSPLSDGKPSSPLSDGRLVTGQPVASTSLSPRSSPSSLSDGRRVVRRPGSGPASVPETLHTGGSCDPHLGATARQIGSAEGALADGNDPEKTLHRGTLTHMFVYPIKSCAGQQVGTGRNGSRCLSTLTHIHTNT